jgi:hypothetical protein
MANGVQNVLMVATRRAGPARKLRVRQRAAGVLLAGVSLVLALGLADAVPTIAAVCPNEATRISLSASLPDCRAYELVTPASKSTAVQDIDLNNSFALPAANGERLALKSLVAFGATPLTNGSVSVFSRTPSGWRTISVPPPDIGADLPSDGVLVSPNLTDVGFTVESQEAPFGETLLFGEPGGPYAEIAKTSETNQGTFLVEASPNLSRLFFASTDHTLISSTPTGTVAGAHDIYEAVNGQRRLVNVTSSGSLVGECGAILREVVEQGSTVKEFFQSPDPEAPQSEPSCQAPMRLYMRTLTTKEGREEGRTEEISAPNENAVELGGPQTVYFARASEDGSKVFFATRAELTKEDEGSTVEQLYEYDEHAPAGMRLTRLSNAGGVATELSPIAHRAESIFSSADGSKVYFRGAGEGMYRFNTVTRELHLITHAYAPQSGGYYKAEGEVTPSGNVFVFTTQGLTDKYNFEEVVRYDDLDGSLTCVSCINGGGPQTGNSSLRGEAGAGAMEEETTNERPSISEVSEDGGYVFFNSTQSLAPQAVNVKGTPSGESVRLPGELAEGQDVYEWHDGVVSLISSPTDERKQWLLGASADGSNVFFLTHSELATQDVDSSADIYDARIDGGFLTSGESAACLGDTCQSIPSPPLKPPLATTAASGSGNLTAPPPPAGKSIPRPKGCPRGSVRRKGKCVKRRRQARRAATGRSAKHEHGGSK